MRERCIEIGADGVAREGWRELADWELDRLQEDRLAALRRELRESGEPLLEAVEELLTATTLPALLAAVISQRQRLEDTLERRAALRAQLRALEELAQA